MADEMALHVAGRRFKLRSPMPPAQTKLLCLRAPVEPSAGASSYARLGIEGGGFAGEQRQGDSERKPGRPTDADTLARTCAYTSNDAIAWRSTKSRTNIAVVERHG